MSLKILTLIWKNIRPVHLSTETLELAKEKLIKQAPEDFGPLLKEQKLIAVQYETTNTCYASVDDVCCKRQKQYRKEHTAEKGTTTNLKRVYNSVIRV